MHALIPAPIDPVDIAAWREMLHDWRASTRVMLNYDGALYDRPEFAWISRTFTLGFVMMCDVLFYHDGDFDLDGYLAHGEREFGGYDALILWHAYPRLGFDDRNQFDFYRQMPGGLPRLRRLVDDCHARGVKAYINYNPWDTGTRRESVSDADALAGMVAALDADAVFLDTMSNAAGGLREKLDAIRPGVSLESEVLVPVEHLNTHPSSWAQSFNDAPGVLRNKWFERRHMQHRIKRWQPSHTPELHTAWMNGTGMVVWENVFGTPVHWCARDKSILRGMIGVQRRYHALFSGEGWTPLIPTRDVRVQASLWEDESTRVWTLVNASETQIAGEVLRLAHRSGTRYFDLIGGDEIAPDIRTGHAALTLNIRARGVGGILAVRDVSPELADFLARQRDIDTRADWDAGIPPVAQRLEHNPTSTIKAPLVVANADDMARFPAHTFDMPVTFTVRECGFYDVPDVDFPSLRYVNLHRDWSLTRRVSVDAFAIDKTPVTNAQFAAFLQSSGYQPSDGDNFLAHWIGGAIPAGLEHHPVVWVDLDDARAYAAWSGKRLPTEEEWQYAAQGIDARLYPWGNAWQPENCNHGQSGGTTPVTQFPQGRTPDGIYDLCGNVWEWTESVRTDGRTRFAILKGGAHYQAPGSEWYADGGAKPNPFAAKFLLLAPSLDRCAIIGFRCAT